MGGLKDALPITYWTFVIGALAIAGVPGLAGFFSKDEILAQTFDHGHTLLWAIGLATSLLTAIYMFRLVFLAFHGPRSGAGAGPAAPNHSAGGQAHPEEEEPAAQQAHHEHLHDAPAPMALALIVLAIGSVLAGYVGLGGRFEHFLEPSFEPQRVEAVAESSAELTLMLVSTGVAFVGIGLGGRFEHFLEPSFEPQRIEAAVESSAASTLMLISTIVAFVGIGVATYFLLRNRRAADRVAEQFGGLRQLLADKYYVDEIYDAAVVQPIRIVSEEALWKKIDARLIDGAVNGAGEIVGGLSEVGRRLQTGSVRTYAASLFVGVVLILGYYLWR